MNTKLSLLLVAVVLLGACNGADLSFINEVKTFEPRWMDLSEKFTFVKRNLVLTDTRYAQDLSQVKSFFDRAPEGAVSQLNSLEAQYKKMVEERDEIQEDYNSRMAAFYETVKEFNTWETRLMKNRLDEEEAKKDFELFKEQQAAQLEAVNDLQSRLIKNVDRHNSLLKSMTQVLGVYTSYQIDPK